MKCLSKLLVALAVLLPICSTGFGEAQEVELDENAPALAASEGAQRAGVAAGTDMGTDTGPDPGQALDTAAAVRLALGKTLSAASSVPAAVAAAVRRAGAGEADWLMRALGVTLSALAVASIVALVARRWADKTLAQLMRRRSSVPAYRASYVLLRTGLMWAADIAFVLVAISVVILIIPSPAPPRMTAVVIIVAVGFFLVLRDLFVSLFLPRRPDERLLALDDSSAARMLRHILLIAIVGALSLGLSAWIGGLGVAEEVRDVVQILASALSALLLGAYLIAHRASISRLIRGDASWPSGGRRIAAAVWLFASLAYLAGAYALNVASIVLFEGPHVGPIIGPIIATAAGFLLYGVLVILLARRFAAQEAALRGRAAGETTPHPVVEVEPITAWRIRWHALLQRLAAIASLLVAVAVLLMEWGLLSLGASEMEWVGLVIVLFASYGLYSAIRTWIDGKIEEEVALAAPGDSEEGMGVGSSRLATLLPLLRNVLVAAVIAIAAMVVLAAMGVDVAPLFAGAGVVGLAIGFGAQTLIRDVFSGAFFLVDDAFRKGEYVDVGGVMGAVEKISLRSFQLRHHNGPLHTIPFGEIKQLTNFSRDWVIMKLPLRIAYGTDVERVRKLVKKLGQELAEDPELGQLFLQPLKSQGVVEMEDSAMIMRVKFMTRPGDQFVARRHVFTRIGELFDREGIRFAHREVTVRIAGSGTETDEATVAAAAGAARTVGDAASPRP